MKKDQIIKGLLSNFYDMEQMGLYNASLITPNQYFGAGAFDRERTENYNPNAQYMYMYYWGLIDEFEGHKPDAVWMAEDGSEVFLFQIED